MIGHVAADCFQFLRDNGRSFFLVSGKFRMRVKIFVDGEQRRQLGVGELLRAFAARRVSANASARREERGRNLHAAIYSSALMHNASEVEGTAMTRLIAFIHGDS